MALFNRILHNSVTDFIICLRNCIFVIIAILSVNTSLAQDNIYGNYFEINLDYKLKDTIPLQPIIDAAKEGDTIILSAGIYSGPITIKQNNIVVDGQGKASVNGGGKASVIVINGYGVVLRNLQICNSGGSHNTIDSGVKLVGSHNTVDNCRIKECLFGIDVSQSDSNYLYHNDISSLSRREIALKGDAIRFWWAKGNKVQGNYWHGVRDMVVWYSSGNSFIENKGVGNRYGIHFMYSHNNYIRGNRLLNNSVGVFLMYSERTIMINNTIEGCTGVSGMCLGMKETSSNQILNNKFLYSTEGIHFDVAPFVPEKRNTIQGNEIAFCGAGMFFHTNQTGNDITENYFHDNLSNVIAEGKTASGNFWEANYWDDYQGFDRDGDNVGDTPYDLYNYVGHLWDYNEDVKFFYGSPLLVIFDFLERLAPFSEPKFVLRDKKPQYLRKKK